MIIDIETELAKVMTDFRDGRLAEAESRCRRLLTAQPKHPDGLHLLGLIALKTGRGDEAISSLRTAAKLAPNNPGYQLNLGLALAEERRFIEAVDAYELAIRLKPDFTGAYLNLGIALKELERVDESVRAYKKAIELQPNLAAAHLNLGNLRKVQGDIEQAFEHYQRASELRPDHARTYYYMSLHGSDGAPALDQRAIDTIETLSAQPGTSVPDAILLHYSMGNAFDDCGDVGRAFNHYEQANRLNKAELSRRGIGFDLAKHGRLTDQLIACFDEDFFASRSAFGSASATPIFYCWHVPLRYNTDRADIEQPPSGWWRRRKGRYQRDSE